MVVDILASVGRDIAVRRSGVSGCRMLRRAEWPRDERAVVSCRCPVGGVGLSTLRCNRGDGLPVSSTLVGGTLRSRVDDEATSQSTPGDGNVVPATGGNEFVSHLLHVLNMSLKRNASGRIACPAAPGIHFPESLHQDPQPSDDPTNNDPANFANRSQTTVSRHDFTAVLSLPGCSSHPRDRVGRYYSSPSRSRHLDTAKAPTAGCCRRQARGRAGGCNGRDVDHGRQLHHGK